MPIPGCENYNASYFSEKKMSIKCDTVEEVIKNTYKLLNSKELQQELMDNQKKYIDKYSCRKICDFIAKMAIL